MADVQVWIKSHKALAAGIGIVALGAVYLLVRGSGSSANVSTGDPNAAA
jgi:hypothetical protein